MRKVFFISTLCLFFTTSAFAQRFAYVDSEYILNNIPEYKEAQKKLDQVAEEWKAEIGNLQKEIAVSYTHLTLPTSNDV